MKHQVSEWIVLAAAQKHDFCRDGCLNPMRRYFADRKISLRTFSPSGSLQNTLKYFYNCFKRMKQTVISHWKIWKSLEFREISFTPSWNKKNISVYSYFISIKAAIRNVQSLAFGNLNAPIFSVDMVISVLWFYHSRSLWVPKAAVPDPYL